MDNVKKYISFLVYRFFFKMNVKNARTLKTVPCKTFYCYRHGSCKHDSLSVLVLHLEVLWQRCYIFGYLNITVVNMTAECRNRAVIMCVWNIIQFIMIAYKGVLRGAMRLSPQPLISKIYGFQGFSGPKAKPPYLILICMKPWFY